MKVLIVGGAGYVGSILRPGFEAEHECSYFDIHPVPGRESRTTVAEVTDIEAAQRALDGMDAVVYLAMGTGCREKFNVSGPRTDISLPGPAFSVNVGGIFNFLHEGLPRGVRKFVYASSLSVFTPEAPSHKLMDDAPPNAWHGYGVSKRAAEAVLQMAAQHEPAGVYVALRLMAPRRLEDFANREPWKDRPCPHLGPLDTTRLFLAALACPHPGAHLIQATGDLEEKFYEHRRARVLLGWSPRGE